MDIERVPIKGVVPTTEPRIAIGWASAGSRCRKIACPHAASWRATTCGTFPVVPELVLAIDEQVAHLDEVALFAQHSIG